MLLDDALTVARATGVANGDSFIRVFERFHKHSHGERCSAGPSRSSTGGWRIAGIDNAAAKRRALNTPIRTLV